ncbi:hypothetical protein EGW08_006827, partial [Elysia chlorotica]
GTHTPNNQLHPVARVTTRRTSSAEDPVRPTFVTVPEAGQRHHGDPPVLVTVRVAMVTDALSMSLRTPQGVQTMDNDASTPTFSAERRDPTQGVCPEPVDTRPPFRPFEATRHIDTTLDPSRGAGNLTAAAACAASLASGVGASRKPRCGCCGKSGRGATAKEILKQCGCSPHRQS